MDPNEDAPYAADSDLDRRLRARKNKGKARHSNESPHGNNSLSNESEDEGAPLLSDGGSSRRPSTHDGEDGANEWFGHAELQGLPWWNRPSIYWLLPPFLLFTMAFGGIVVPKLNLIIDLICEDYYATHENDNPLVPQDPGTDRCRDANVSAQASLFMLFASFIGGILSAISSPKLGALSDRYGRKPILVLTTIGALIGEVITIITAKYPQYVDLNWLLVGYAIDGLAGSFIVGMAIAHSYATDCTPPQKRNVVFGYFHACLFSGIAVGPILAGYIIKAREPIVGKTEAVLLVFYIALGCHTGFVLFLLFAIPESLSKGRQEAAREKHRQEVERLGPANDWINQIRRINLFEPLKILWPTGPGTSSALRWNLMLLALTDTIMFGVHMGAMAVITIYIRHAFGWQEWESSKFVSIVNATRVVALLVVLPLITRWVRGKAGTKNQKNSGCDLFDLTIIRVAIFLDMLGYVGFSLASQGNMFLVAGAVGAFGGMGSPALGSALTKHVPPDSVGQLLGATGLLHAISRVFGPVAFNGIYWATVASFKQTVFVCLAATFGAAFICSWFVRPHVQLETIGPDGAPLTAQRSSDDHNV